MARKQQSLEVLVETLNSDGHGQVTYIDSQDRTIKVEIPKSLPGDRMRVTLLRKKRGWRRGLLEEHLEESPLRIEPACPHFSQCGGCRLQHLSYENQLEHKQQLLDKLFEELNPTQGTLPIVPCEDPWRYRNKMEFSFSESKDGTQFLGLIAGGSRGRVLNLTDCQICSPWMMEALEVTRKWWAESELHAFHAPSDKGSLRCLTLREGVRTGDRLATLLVSGNPEYAIPRAKIERWVELIKESCSGGGRLGVFLRIQQAVKGSPTQFFEMHLEGPDHFVEELHRPDDSKVSLAVSACDG